MSSGSAKTIAFSFSHFYDFLCFRFYFCIIKYIKSNKYMRFSHSKTFFSIHLVTEKLKNQGEHSDQNYYFFFPRFKKIYTFTDINIHINLAKKEIRLVICSGQTDSLPSISLNTSSSLN